MFLDELLRNAEDTDVSHLKFTSEILEQSDAQEILSLLDELEAPATAMAPIPLIAKPGVSIEVIIPPKKTSRLSHLHSLLPVVNLSATQTKAATIPPPHPTVPVLRKRKLAASTGRKLAAAKRLRSNTGKFTKSQVKWVSISQT